MDRMTSFKMADGISNNLAALQVLKPQLRNYYDLNRSPYKTAELEFVFCQAENAD